MNKAAGADNTTSSWKQHRGSICDTAKEFTVIDCIECGFRHIIPIPTAEELEKVYRDEYYSIEKPLYIERYQEDIEWWNQVYIERYEMMEQILPPTRRRILDIGSGPGFFLLQGQKRGWHPMGIEPSLQSAQFSAELGLEIRNEFLTEQNAATLGTFDVVHLCNVLEHLPDPVEMLEIAKNLLNPGGLLFAVVPNDYNPLQETLRASGCTPWWVAPPHHINYFTFDSLGKLLTKTGFKVVTRQTTFPMELFLLMGDNYIGNDVIGRQCHSKRKQLEIAMATPTAHAIKQKLYSRMAELGIGREIILIAQAFANL